MAPLLAGLSVLDCVESRRGKTTLGASSAWNGVFLMNGKEQLVNRCLATATVQRLSGNDHVAELLEECAETIIGGQQ